MRRRNGWDVSNVSLAECPDLALASQTEHKTVADPVVGDERLIVWLENNLWYNLRVPDRGRREFSQW